MFRTLSDRTTVAQHRQYISHAIKGGVWSGIGCLNATKCASSRFTGVVLVRTFIFANIFESEDTIRILPLYYADLAKSALANNTQ